MNFIKSALITLSFCLTSAYAQPASEASIKQLLELAQARKLVDTLLTQMEPELDKASQSALAGFVPTPKQQLVLDNMKKAVHATVRAELAWEFLEPMYIRVYQDALTEEEVAGMLAFYKTPAGQAVIHKMPVLMQSLMQQVLQITQRMQSKVQKIQEKFEADMAEAKQ